MKHPSVHYLIWVTLWAVAALPAVFLIPLTPIDETRYASVAWEMWTHGSFLVPLLNGEPYSHKGPVLFWLIHSGWALFGVNEWWPRLLPALFALACVFLTHRLARRLWPDSTTAPLLAPLLLLGAALWMFFIPVLLFDIILTFWVLLAVTGLMSARQNGGIGGWITFSIATGLGLLTKGPVMLLHVIIPALLVPVFISSGTSAGLARWFVSLAIALTGSILLGLSWALPAAFIGGEAYARAILWGQTSGRMVKAFSHPAPWWWYLPLLPLILFPWLWWPLFWRGLRRLPGSGVDKPTRFCMSWAALVFIAFSLISGKRMHYLMPLLPVFSLFAARVIEMLPDRQRHAPGPWPVASVFIVLALIFAAAPILQTRLDMPEWVAHLPLSIAAIWLFAALLLLIPTGPLTITMRTAQISAIVILSVSLTRTLVFSEAGPGYDMREVSRLLYDGERNGVPIAHVGSYDGQYAFPGRLQRPLTLLNVEDIPAWLEDHPDGVIIAYRNTLPETGEYPPAFSAPYRSKWVVVRTAGDYGHNSSEMAMK